LANDQVFSCCFDDFFGHHTYLVNLKNTLNLRAKAVNQTKVSPSDPNNRRNRFHIAKVVWLQAYANLLPLMLKDKTHFL